MSKTKRTTETTILLSPRGSAGQVRTLSPHLRRWFQGQEAQIVATKGKLVVIANLILLTNYFPTFHNLVSSREWCYSENFVLMVCMSHLYTHVLCVIPRYHQTTELPWSPDCTTYTTGLSILLKFCYSPTLPIVDHLLYIYNYSCFLSLFVVYYYYF